MNNDIKTKIKEYKDIEIKYVIDKAKRKTVYLVIKNDIVYVKIGSRMTERDANYFLEKNIEWVYKKYKEILKKNKLKKEFKIENGTKIFFAGKEYTICIKNVDKQIDNSRKKVIIKKENNLIVFYIKNQEESNAIDLIKCFKEFEKSELEKIINSLRIDLEKKMDLKANVYRIRELKTAWGTCSTTKNISINLELIKYDINIIKHVLIHEMAHLKYMNHSKQFWDLVSKYDENYKENRYRLKKNIY